MHDLAPALPAGGGMGGDDARPVPARGRARGAARARRRRLFDRLATLIVRAGGLGIIASILAILLFIVAEVLPLLSAATVSTAKVLPVPGGTVGALLADAYGTHVGALDIDGRLRVVRVSDGAVVAEGSLIAAGAPALTAVHVPPSSAILTAASADGRVLLAAIDWASRFEGQSRVVSPALGEPVALQVDPGARPITVYDAGVGPDGGRTAAAQLADGSLAVVRQRSAVNEFSGEVTSTDERLTAVPPGALTQLVLDKTQRNLYASSAAGELLWWTLGGATLGAPQTVAVGGAPVTALSLLIGGRSLVVGQADGSLSIWFAVPQPDGPARLTRIRDFPPQEGAIAAIAPSHRDKGFLALDAGGGLGLYFSTSQRVLWTGRAPVPGGGLDYGARGTSAYLGGDGQLAVLDVFNPHPEISPWSLFGRVWYEGAPEPALVWQSSSGTDDFEPKLSLTPLLFGTLKGTVYSLLIAIPLAVFGAMYLSQFMHPRLKALVKPAVEIMAALPSVVLGFLAGLWLAPRVQRLFPALLLMAVLFPLLTVAAGTAWEAVPRRLRGRVPAGTEVLLFALVLGLGIWLAISLSWPFEQLAFAGNFQAWLLDTTGLPYDQRNAIIVGLAMGFAVIPIIFAIAEEAFSNVPRELVSGSLALGANRWQTVTRIVLPTASPGIFSAIMVGFGRAVGETMIVLMATGNTPIMDWNPFNGFRTLSANIAVEIPEAPVGATLYRVLFLAALLLFAVTFAVNTAAELVRQRLRRRYAQL